MHVICDLQTSCSQGWPKVSQPTNTEEKPSMQQSLPSLEFMELQEALFPQNPDLCPKTLDCRKLIQVFLAFWEKSPLKKPNFRGLSGTFGAPPKLSGTFGEVGLVNKTFGDFRGISKSFGDFWGGSREVLGAC